MWILFGEIFLSWNTHWVNLTQCDNTTAKSKCKRGFLHYSRWNYLEIFRSISDKKCLFICENLSKLRHGTKELWCRSNFSYNIVSVYIFVSAYMQMYWLDKKMCKIVGYRAPVKTVENDWNSSHYSSYNFHLRTSGFLQFFPYDSK